MRRTGLFVVALALALAGCKKEKSAPSDDLGPKRDGAALWKLAPEGTKAGVVLAPGTLADLHAAAVAVAGSLQSLPVAAKGLDKIRAEAGKVGVDPFSEKGLAPTGVDLSRGAAAFFTEENGAPYLIMPIADRAAFVKLVKGKTEDGTDILDGSACRVVDEQYRCAPTKEKLDAWKPVATALDKGWPKELRGSIEFFVSGELLRGAEPIEKTMDSASRLIGAVQISRGAALVRFLVEGKAKKMLAVGQTPLADATKASKPAAILVGYAGAVIDLIRAKLGQRINKPGPGGITPKQVLDSFTGEVVAFAPAGGAPRGFVELGIRDPEPLRKLSALCALAPPLAPGVAISKTDKGCAVKAGPPALPQAFEASIEIEDKAIVASIGDASGGRESKGSTDLPGLLRDHQWLGAAWMRGSLVLGADALPGDQIKTMLQQMPQIAAGLWGYAHLSELGAGVRTDDAGIHGFFRVATTWTNPPEVTKELEPLIARFTKGDLAAAKDIEALGKKHGDTPLGRDVAMGSSGGVIGAAAVGTLAAVAIPAFLKYEKRAKSTEAIMFLNKLYAGALQYSMEAQATGLQAQAGGFPKKSTAITPPLGTCCAEGGKCSPKASYWTDETWVELKFSVDDPHTYSYQYEVAPDGKSFTVRAFGDLDCDGTYSTFEMRGGEGGAPGITKTNEYE